MSSQISTDTGFLGRNEVGVWRERDETREERKESEGEKGRK